MTAAVMPEPSRVRVLFAGVGGQGVLAAARTLGAAAMAAGIPVTVSQLHGMSQRGGAVEATVNLGSDRVLPVDSGAVDVLVGLERLEALRHANRAGRGTLVLLNSLRLPPPHVARTGAAMAPDAEIEAALRSCAGSLRLVDAGGLAARAGSPRAANAVLLGVLAAAGVLPIAVPVLRAAVVAELPEAYREAGARAFDLGVAAGGA